MTKSTLNENHEKQIVHTYSPLQHLKNRPEISSTDRLAFSSEGLVVRLYDSLCSLDRISNSPNIARRRVKSECAHTVSDIEGFTPNASDDVLQETLVPPDGGYGWIIVAASLINICIISGHGICFSLLYPAIVSYFEADYGVVGWIGSLNLAMSYFPAFLYSELVHKLGCRMTTMIGAGISCLGYVLSFFCTTITQLYITYGLISGVGIGIMFLPNIVIVQQYFDKKRALAAGISLSGFSIGIIVCSILLQYALTTYGWKGAMLLSGGVCLNGVAFGALFIPPEQWTNSGKLRAANLVRSNTSLQNGKCSKTKDTNKEIRVEKHKLSNEMHHSAIESLSEKTLKSSQMMKFIQVLRNAFDFSLLKEVSFLLFGFGSLMTSFGVQTFYIHTPNRALYYGIETRYVALLPSVMGTSSILSRIVFSFVANLSWVNRTFQYALGILIGGLLELAYTLSTDFISICIGCIAIGIANAMFLTVQSTVLVDLLSVDRIAKSQGLFGLFIGTASLVASPFAGFIYDVTANYNIPFYINGGIQTCGSLLIFIVYFIEKGKTTDK